MLLWFLSKTNPVLTQENTLQPNYQVVYRHPWSVHASRGTSACKVFTQWRFKLSTSSHLHGPVSPHEGLTNTQEGAYQSVCCIMLGGLGWIISAMIIVSGRFQAAPDFRAERHKPAAAGKSFPQHLYLGCSHNRLNMLVRVNYEWETSTTLVLLFPFLGCGFSNRFHLLTRFLKSAVTSLVNTARLRKPVDTSLLSWVRWLFPKFSRISMYCSLFSTWAGKKTTHTHRQNEHEQKVKHHLKRNVQII